MGRSVLGDGVLCCPLPPDFIVTTHVLEVKHVLKCFTGLGPRAEELQWELTLFSFTFKDETVEETKWHSNASKHWWKLLVCS